MGQILLAREEPYERATFLRAAIPDCAAQRWILRFQCIDHGAQRDFALDLQLHFVADFGERPQMMRKNDPDRHGSVCASTDNTAGKSRTIGFQVSPPSAEA